MTIKDRYGNKRVGNVDIEEAYFAVVHERSPPSAKLRCGKSTGRFQYVYAILISMMFVLGAFVVIPAGADGPAIVDLGTAEDFVILAKAGISTTGTTHITGDIGASPASASYITGFDLIMDATGTFSSSSVVAGKIYASDYTSPTPTKMTAAVSDMETAYADAAGRTSPDYTELYAGDVTGETLTPGLYKWGTGLLISEGGVTISGTSSDVWIFQIAGDLTVADSAIVTLSGGAKATNIFWQVAGHVTIGTTVAMQGIILCQAEIVFNTGATLIGRALSQTAITMDASAIVDPTNTVPPTVSSTTPSNLATDVAVNIAITATFSKAMTPSTITTTTFTLKQGTTAVSGTVTYAGVSAVFTPLSNLATDTTYTVTITTGATDLTGNPLTSSYVWSFDTSMEVTLGTGTITGRLVDDNGDPIQNATVSLGDTGLTATTNSNGEYTFTDVPTGTYTLGFDANGYEPASTSATVTDGETSAVPNTTLAPVEAGLSNGWWVLILVAAVAVAAIVGLSMMNKNKAKKSDTKGKKAGRDSNKQKR